MRRNETKARLMAGEVVVGSWLGIPSAVSTTRHTTTAAISIGLPS